MQMGNALPAIDGRPRWRYERNLKWWKAKWTTLLVWWCSSRLGADDHHAIYYRGKGRRNRGAAFKLVFQAGGAEGRVDSAAAAPGDGYLETGDVGVIADVWIEGDKGRFSKEDVVGLFCADVVVWGVGKE